MDTIQYTLKSQPKITINVPKDYHECADALIDLLTQTPVRVGVDIRDHPYLGNIGILSKARELLKTPYEHPRHALLQDALYLRVCINCNEKRIRGPDRGEAIQLDSVLIDLVQSVESSR